MRKPDNSPPLAPPLAAAVEELLSRCQSTNTRRSYTSALRRSLQWFSTHYGSSLALPIPVHGILKFIDSHSPRLQAQIDHHPLFERQRSLATLKHRLSVLSQLHAAHAGSNPCEDWRVRDRLALLARKLRADTQSPTMTVNASLLERVADSCDDSMLGRRDRAILLFAWTSGGATCSQIVAARIEMLTKTRFGYVYKRPSLRESFGPSTIGIYGLAAQAVSAWLLASGLRHGAIFRRVRSDGSVGSSLSPGGVREILRTRCTPFGVESNVTMSALRRGFIEDARARGVPASEIMAMTGIVSPSTLHRYFCRGRPTIVATERRQSMMKLSIIE